jgi:SAM-dependent methyltransferase
VYNALVARGEPSDVAQRFVLQCVVALFAEDIDLLPRGLFTEILDDCHRGGSSYDLIGGLFRQMGNSKPAGKGSRFQDVRYFNGGIFATVEPLSLEREEVDLLVSASKEKWSKVEPAIFGTLFEGSLGKGERHALGAHFTSEADIQKVILPTIVRPWRERIESARTMNALVALRQELTQFRVLDPACGSGNFLYVAYREMKRLEGLLLAKIYENFSTGASIGNLSLLSTRQFYGIDVNRFAVELAKVTLMLGKKLALDEENKLLNVAQLTLPIELEPALPLDNLDTNIVCDDALFCNWPKVDAIVGNPPYQAKNKMQRELGHEYVAKLRKRYPEVPGRADYCVYWFRRAHDELDENKRAGLVGTNTIRQNYSREGGLDYIVGHRGTITDAVSTQVWSGDAVVHVSIVNWIKGELSGKKTLLTQLGDDKNSPWRKDELDFINSALSAKVDVTQAKTIAANAHSGTCYQGQTHGHKGFLLSVDQARQISHDAKSRNVIHLYLTGDDLLSPEGAPSRFVIDLNHCDDLFAAMQHGQAFKRVQELVLPDMKKAAEEERQTTGKNTGPRQAHFDRWWKFWRGRQEMLDKIASLNRYIACARVTKRPIFEFVASPIRPNDALQVFAVADDYSFGVLQSTIHWVWFNERCSTLKGDFRYTSDTVFDSFPFPQSPTKTHVERIATTSRELRQLRHDVMAKHNWGLRELYRTLDLPGDSPLRKAQDRLDAAVREAYGMKPTADPLQFILALNFEVGGRESNGLAVTAPGLPPIITDPTPYISDDCVKGLPL